MRRFETLAVGQTIVTPDVVLTREAVIDFAAAYDPQPFHLDEKAAAETYFGRLAASGWHTASASLSRIASDRKAGLAIVDIDEIMDLRWRAPVYPDEPLTITLDILHIGAIEHGAGAVRLAVTTRGADGNIRFSMRCTVRVASDEY